MSNEIDLSTFPTNKISALTMLYLSKLDFANLTPEQLADKYSEVYAAIHEQFKTQRYKRD